MQDISIKNSEEPLWLCLVHTRILRKFFYIFFSKVIVDSKVESIKNFNKHSPFYDFYEYLPQVKGHYNRKYYIWRQIKNVFNLVDVSTLISLSN